MVTRGASRGEILVLLNLPFSEENTGIDRQRTEEYTTWRTWSKFTKLFKDRDFLRNQPDVIAPHFVPLIDSTLFQSRDLHHQLNKGIQLHFCCFFDFFFPFLYLNYSPFSTLSLHLLNLLPHYRLLCVRNYGKYTCILFKAT